MGVPKLFSFIRVFYHLDDLSKNMKVFFLIVLGATDEEHEGYGLTVDGFPIDPLFHDPQGNEERIEGFQFHMGYRYPDSNAGAHNEFPGRYSLCESQFVFHFACPMSGFDEEFEYMAPVLRILDEQDTLF